MTPTATYRLQLTPEFPFSAATAAVPYLASLGISHLHLSPVLEAVPGSTHGYDVTDPGRVRAELGGEDGLRELSRTAREHGLGLVLDIVPNHMSASPKHNHALWEVLREGPDSPYARWFDIDWEAAGGQLLMPVLGGRVGGELEHLKVDGDVLRYHDHAFPLRAGTEKLPLPELLDAQWYRLGWWRLARTELNYRRFFTISELIGVRVDDEEVFRATHGTILRLLDEGVADGLRIDHPDGLADPEGYLRRLHEASGGRWTVVEKILTDGEPLPASWPVAGTTGYDALRHVDGLFTDPVGTGGLLDHYRAYASPPGDRGGYWQATVRRAAYKVVTHELAAEVDHLTRAAAALCATDPALRDHAPWALRTALRELMVRVPVYRPYGPGDEDVLTPGAAEEARAAFVVPEEATAVDAVRDLALGRLGDTPAHLSFMARFAQTVSALHAKSVEDTAFYRYPVLLSTTEVGGNPGRPGVTQEEFHAFCGRLQRDWPETGTVLSTHDTKRSADVRARIALLSECPERWAELLGGLDGAQAPDPHLAWAAWQTAVGLGLPDAGRLGDALLKHAREAGLHTSWTEQDPLYEDSVRAFVEAGPAGPAGYTVALFDETLSPYVRANVLGTALLHLTMPGVPDVYQGTEQLSLTLVDPDNRRPVDFEAPEDVPANGLALEKHALTTAALHLRRDRPELFGAQAAYTPLAADGPAAQHCVAFVRSGAVLTAVTRLSLRLEEAGGWRDTRLTLPEGRWGDALAPDRHWEGTVDLAELLGERPVALLRKV
ncbi:malto-oligosyltrehalose synthase [Streptomyces sp. NPDC060194]|uniref:malto-oligosyltrehalose synthase n=1 Tax=Streptomyces sp. NPDC060194 TaxID=3347069 RepID=UPI0036640102